MRIGAVLLLILFSPFLVFAGQSNSKPSQLTDNQALGRRIFEQRCGVCHTQPSPASPMYGVPLYKDVVEGNEEAMRDYIRNGSRRMPGFKYGLAPAEIDAIVDYLKTVPKPAAHNSQPKTEGPVD